LDDLIVSGGHRPSALVMEAMDQSILVVDGVGGDRG
jgi:hypothetical protein